MSIFSKPEPAYLKRNYGLDIVRAAAITLVIFGHSTILLAPPVVQLKQILYLLGFPGVELFFVLSGFLIGTSIIKSYEQKRSYTLKTIMHFWTMRCLRILPIYYIMLTANILFYYYSKKQLYIDWGYWLFTHNFFTVPSKLFMPEAWFLSIIIWFYIAFPITLALISLLFKNSSHKLHIFVSTIFFLLTGLILRIIAVSSIAPAWDEGIRKIVIFRIDAIPFGVLIAYINFYYKQFYEKNIKKIFMVSFLLVIPSFYMFICDVLSGSFGFFNKTFLFPIFDLGLACILPIAQNFKIKKSTLVSRSVTHISLMSYAMYLTHFLVISGLNRARFASLIWTRYSIFWIIMIMLSFMVYRYIEVPVSKLSLRNCSDGRQ